MSAIETLAALTEGLITEAEAVEQLMVDTLSEAYRRAAAEQFGNRLRKVPASAASVASR